MSLLLLGDTAPRLLDDIPNVVGAFSSRLLLSSYRGPLTNVRRSSDNARRDLFPLGDGSFPVAQFTDFVSGGSGFNRTWFNQNGSGANISQATAAFQPAVTLATQNGHPGFTFDGAATSMTIGALTAAASDLTIFAVAKPDAMTGFRYFWDFATGRLLGYANYNLTNTIGWYDGTNDIQGAAATAAAQVITWRMTTGAGAASIFRDGVSAGTGTYAQRALGGNARLGSVNDGSASFYSGSYLEFIVIGSLLTPTQQQTMERRLRSEWGTP